LAKPHLRLAALVLLSLAGVLPLGALPVGAQQPVHIKVDGGTPDTRGHIPAQLYRPLGVKRGPAVALFHGCGGVGQNNARMADLLKSWGYAALVVDSFSSRGMKDVCGRNWPTQADAEKRALDIDAAAMWLAAQDFVDPQRIAYMGYSYGGGVGLSRALSGRPASRAPSSWKAAVLVYPDCGLGEPIGTALRPRLPTFIAMAELDDWTPVKQCEALFNRVSVDRDLIETHVYPGAHHSFDALGLPVRYLSSVGNRSKPGGCCGAHYGANEAAWKAFVTDVKAFLAKNLPVGP
jgi:dienelactone hydrolase